MARLWKNGSEVARYQLRGSLYSVRSTGAVLRKHPRLGPNWKIWASVKHSREAGRTPEWYVELFERQGAQKVVK